jgi:hypothetical protein
MAERFMQRTPENPVVFVQIGSHADHIYSLMAFGSLPRRCNGAQAARRPAE